MASDLDLMHARGATAHNEKLAGSETGCEGGRACRVLQLLLGNWSWCQLI